MQVRHLFAAALLAATTVGALAAEIEPREQHQDFTASRSRESVRAEVRNLQAQGQLKQVGEFAQAPVTGAAPQVAEAPKTREQVRAETKQWFATHKQRVGELG